MDIICGKSKAGKRFPDEIKLRECKSANKCMTIRNCPLDIAKTVASLKPQKDIFRNVIWPHK